jgi:hypothetical protein
MKLDKVQKTMLAIISVFENGKTHTYGQTFWNAETSELSGGMLMASTLSGNMYDLLKKYQASGGQKINPKYISILSGNDPKKLTDTERDDFRAQFKTAGSDPIMIETQLDYFSDQFLAKAEQRAETVGVTEPLGRLVILDSTVQGGFGKIIALMPKFYDGTETPLNQWDWTKTYIQKRLEWLSNSSNHLLQHTVDRLQSIQPLVAANNWKLDLPIFLSTKGYTITEADL